MEDFSSSDSGDRTAFPTSGQATTQDSDRNRPVYSIGEIAREYGFTLRALRFYEEKGLVTPRRSGNRRLYSLRDRRRLEIIAQCKRIGLPLDEIRQILKDGDGGNERRMMETALDKCLARIELIHAEQQALHDSLQEALLLAADLKRKVGKAA